MSAFTSRTLASTRGVRLIALFAAAIVAQSPARADLTGLSGGQTRVRQRSQSFQRAQASQRSRHVRRHKASHAQETPACGDPVAFQVLLDRQGISPGQIDGKLGTNAQHALAAFQQSHGLMPTAVPDCPSWQALGGDRADATLAAYTITDADVKGPFTERIPRDLVEQAKLPALGYTSALEEIAERFHASPALLRQLNAGKPFTAGQSIQVPAVTPFDPSVKPTTDPAAGELTIQVSRAESALRATRADGALVFFAPVSSGSIHDPLPPGNWKVTSVNWHPEFHYNPDLFWDAKPEHTKATIKPGPNNPVGVVWIALDLEHYGLHGTPEPGHIGYTESHGCVRLTNWDAAHLAALVRAGTPVVFQ